MNKISVVIPLYKCSHAINELSRRLINTLSSISEDFEIIFVNDASPENDWEIVVELSKKDKRIKGINFSRNFGQHHAITAGLDYAKGKWVVVMDGDLQDQPEEILRFYNKILEGYDIVLGKRIDRKDSYLKKALSKWFYKLFSYLAETDFDSKIGTFRIMSKKVVESYRLLNEKIMFFGAMINWLGFRVETIEISHRERTAGNSTYSLRKRMHLAINGILSFSDRLLRITIKTGVILSIITFLFILLKVFQNLLYGTSVMGWSSLIAAIGFSTGLIITVIGIVGLYVGSIFKEVKKRPNYICMEVLNLEANKN